jgi:reactive intermediate/imine deaminase
LGLLSAVLACAAQAAEVTHLHGSGVMPDSVPFSEMVQVDDTYYLSGQLGNRPGTLELVEGGMPAEARQTLSNIRTVLEHHGLSMRDVVKCTVMMADISEWGAFNAIYSEFFEAPYPARSAFGANELALGARLEVECMAVAGEPD